MFHGVLVGMDTECRMLEGSGYRFGQQRRAYVLPTRSSRRSPSYAGHTVEPTVHTDKSITFWSTNGSGKPSEIVEPRTGRIWDPTTELYACAVQFYGQPPPVFS